jgi:hypothetical protein
LIPPEIGELTALTVFHLNQNKLSGAIPGTLTLLTKATTDFRLDTNPGLCRIDAASTTVTTAGCTTACPYPTCACTVATCPSGATNSGSTVVNPATPFYPADDTACCPVGKSVREELVKELHLDCSVGRPCVATTGTPGKGTLALAVALSRYAGYTLTSSIPPEISGLTALTLLRFNDHQTVTGSIPPGISKLTALKELLLYNTKLIGSIPPEISELTAVGSITHVASVNPFLPCLCCQTLTPSLFLLSCPSLPLIDDVSELAAEQVNGHASSRN